MMTKVICVLLALLVSGCAAAPRTEKSSLKSEPYPALLKRLPPVELVAPAEDAERQSVSLQINVFRLEFNAAPQRGNMVIGTQTGSTVN